MEVTTKENNDTIEENAATEDTVTRQEKCVPGPGEVGERDVTLTNY